MFSRLRVKMYKTRLTREQMQKNNDQVISVICLVILSIWVFLLVGCSTNNEQEIADMKLKSCVNEMTTLFKRMDYDTANNMINWCYTQSVTK